MADQWEYRSFLVNGPDIEEALNRLGQEGWECVTATAVGWSATSATDVPGIVVFRWAADQYRVLLKRRKQ